MFKLPATPTNTEEAESYIQASDTWELNLHISTLEAINPGKIFSDEIKRSLMKL